MNDFTFRVLEDNEYDTEINNLSGHFTQSFLYKKWQEKRTGVEVYRFILNKNDQAQFFFQSLVGTLTGSTKQMYIPHGPIALSDNIDEETINSFIKELRVWAKKNKIAFIRFDPQGLNHKILHFLKHKIKASPENGYHTVLAQPRFEWITDIKKNEEELISTLPKNTRYSIRSAQSRGTKIKIINSNLDSYFDIFYNLLRETSLRGHFKLHPENYYRHILQTTEEFNQGFLVLAEFEDEVLAANLITIYGQTALHVFGGSSEHHRDKFPTYLAHWHGFLESQKRGAASYSFGGISSDDKNNDSWKNITAFKKQFTGEIKDFGQLLDLPTLPFWYYLYKIKKNIDQFFKK